MPLRVREWPLLFFCCMIEYNQQNTTGWFIGFLEKENHVYFFATDIHNKNGAAGSTAVQITLSALSDLALWGSPQDEVYR